MRKRRLFLLFVLSAVVAVSTGIGYYAAGFRPTGRGVGNATYLFFDYLPSVPFTAAFFALILASRMRRVAATSTGRTSGFCAWTLPPVSVTG